MGSDVTADFNKMMRFSDLQKRPSIDGGVTETIDEEDPPFKEPSINKHFSSL